VCFLIVTMAAMTESCSVCGTRFDVQFRYQMEERDGGFAFFCSHECHRKAVSGEATGGATCSACQKRFYVELVSQVVRVRGELRHACSDECRKQILAESDGARLGAMGVPPAPVTIASATPPPPVLSPPLPIGVPAPPAQIPVPAPATAAASRASARFHAPQRLAIFNHKGGTGKTTTSVSLAAGLAARGIRVLLVDTDSQGNVSVSLGVKAERTLYHVLVMGMRATDVAVKVRENLDLVVSNETLAAAELYLAGKQNRDRVLRERLASAFEAYDIVLLDCSPSLSLMNQNALVVADGIIVPVACDFLSLVGVRQVIKTVKNVNQLLHHPVQIHGVLPTFYDARARICRDAVHALEEHFGDRVMPPIRQATRLKEAPAQGKTIYEYAPESNAAQDYATVVDLLVDGPKKGTSRARAVGE
jgi:chromosome partitioning protein